MSLVSKRKLNEVYNLAVLLKKRKALFLHCYTTKNLRIGEVKRYTKKAMKLINILRFRKI